MEKELCLFDEYFQGYWILKCPHCALCKHCSDIWYDYKNGPYMAMCEKENSNSNELGKGCIHFEVDKDYEYVCTLDELEAKLQALKEETQDAKEVASKILGVPEFDEKFIEQFAKDLMIPKEYLKRIKRSMTKYRGIVKWNGDHYDSGEEVIGSKIKFENGKMYLYDDEPINVFPYYGEARNQWVEIESFEKIEDFK